MLIRDVFSLTFNKKKKDKKKKRKSIWKASPPLERRRAENSSKRGTGDDTEMARTGRGRGQSRSSFQRLGYFTRRPFELAGLASQTQMPPMQFFQKNNNNNNHVDLVCFFSPSTLAAVAGFFASVPSVSSPDSRLH